jgi:hypothetical protein
MNAPIKPQYTLTVDCDKCPGASCTDCGGEGVIPVCSRCEFVECLCTDDEDEAEADVDNAWNLGLTDARPW